MKYYLFSVNIPITLSFVDTEILIGLIYITCNTIDRLFCFFGILRINLMFIHNLFFYWPNSCTQNWDKTNCYNILIYILIYVTTTAYYDIQMFLDVEDFKKPPVALFLSWILIKILLIIGIHSFQIL